MFNKNFQALYKKYGVDAVDHYKQVSEKQLQVDIQSLYGALQLSMRSGFISTELIRYEEEQDGLKVWFDLIETYDDEGNRII